MSDHYHYGYADERHEHFGTYADPRHEHGYYDLAGVAEEHHRHYDLEQQVASLREEIAALWERVNEMPGAI
jgi:uncharacterized protein YceH (UPF0502 family)